MLPIQIAVLEEICYTTDIGRGESAVFHLHTLVNSGLLSPANINLLLVGVGHHGKTGLPDARILCPYEVYNVAASLEFQGIDYTMTLVDIDQRSLQDVATRNHIYVPKSFLATHPVEEPEQNWRWQAWQRYLHQTQQEGSLTYSARPGLVIEPAEKSAQLLRRGIHYASIPSSFKTKRKQGEVILKTGDITDVDLDTSFDYAVCSNVLYMLSAEKQQQAVQNIISALRRPGAMYVWEPFRTKAIRRPISPLLTENGGWLNNESARNLGVYLEKLEEPDDRSVHFLLIKK